MTILLQIGCRPIGHINPDQIYFSDLEEFGCYRKGDQLRARNSLGVQPAIRLNIRLKCCGYWNPRS